MIIVMGENITNYNVQVFIKKTFLSKQLIRFKFIQHKNKKPVCIL